MLPQSSGTDLKAACALLNSGPDRGTGFLVTPERLFTCNHVVKNAGNDPVVVTFPHGRYEAMVELVDAENDCALLRLTRPVPRSHAQPLVLANTTVGKGASWEAYGFPSATGLAGLLIDGRVQDPTGQDQSLRQAVVLQSAAVTAGSWLSGFSGSPVLIENKVIGQMRTIIPDESGGAQMAVIYACPVGILADLARRRYQASPAPESLDNGKRVLVVGTGNTQIDGVEKVAAEAIGEALASAGYRLISGGWPGVDQVVTESFRAVMERLGLRSYDRIVQVLKKGRLPTHTSGRIERVGSDSEEFARSIDLADAIVLIGGRGGTYQMYQRARTARKPVFALAATDGDAKRAYFDMQDYWPADIFRVVTMRDYASLSEPVGTNGRSLGQHVLDLVGIEFGYTALPKDNKPISQWEDHKDAEQDVVQRLHRTVLKAHPPAEALAPASQLPTENLIAIGPDVIARGELLGTTAQTWRLHLWEPFVLGDLNQLSRFDEEFESLKRGDRYLIVEAHNVGRLIASPTSWRREHGKLLVDVTTAPRLPRANATKLPTDISVADFGKEIAGLDTVQQIVAATLAAMKGRWRMGPEYGSRIAEYQVKLKPSRELLQSLIKTEILRLAYVPHYDPFAKTEELAFDFVESVESVSFVKDETRDQVHVYTLQLRLHGVKEPWVCKMKVGLPQGEHWPEGPDQVDQQFVAQLLRRSAPHPSRT